MTARKPKVEAWGWWSQDGLSPHGAYFSKAQALRNEPVFGDHQLSRLVPYDPDAARVVRAATKQVKLSPELCHPFLLNAVDRNQRKKGKR